MTQAEFGHWNVEGIEFFKLHELFDEIAAVLESHADSIAERTEALGGEATGTARMAAANSTVPEVTPSAVTEPQMVEQLATRLAIRDAKISNAHYNSAISTPRTC